MRTFLSQQLRELLSGSIPEAQPNEVEELMDNNQP
jgi:hypothetical protein